MTINQGIHEKNVLRKEMEAAVPKIQTCIMCREHIKNVDPFVSSFTLLPLHYHLVDPHFFLEHWIFASLSDWHGIDRFEEDIRKLLKAPKEDIKGDQESEVIYYFS